MEYKFEQKVSMDGNKGYMEIPFNVWEICKKEGDVPAKVTIDKTSFACNLEPKGNGYYNIPISDEVIHQFKEGVVYPVTFFIMVRSAAHSPYSTTNPIRVIDSIENILQPHDGLCGQSCIAMLAGITLEDTINVMHCSEWQATMGKMIEALDYFGISHAEEIIYTVGKEATLPKCCIIMEKMGRYSHYLIHYDGTFYDSSLGVLHEYDLSKMMGYLEIIVPQYVKEILYFRFKKS